MCSSRMYILQDAREGACDRTREAKDKVHNRNSDNSHAKGDYQDYNEGFDHRLRRIVLDELNQAPYSVHPSYQKTITTMHKLYFCPRMKRDITAYMAQCQTCQRVKVEHQNPAGMLFG